MSFQFAQPTYTVFRDKLDQTMCHAHALKIGVHRYSDHAMEALRRKDDHRRPSWRRADVDSNSLKDRKRSELVMSNAPCVPFLQGQYRVRHFPRSPPLHITIPKTAARRREQKTKESGKPALEEARTRILQAFYEHPHSFLFLPCSPRRQHTSCTHQTQH